MNGVMKGMILVLIIAALIFRAKMIRRRRNESTRRANML